MRLVSAPPKRVSIWMLRPSIHPKFLKSLLERRHAGLSFPIVGRSHQQPDPPHALALLRARRQRPRSRRAAEQRDELAASDHSITSSARVSKVGGTSMTRALGVVGFMMRSNLVGCSTGRSAGFAPRRILST